MIYWAKFEGKLFFDPECTGPLLQTLPLNTIFWFRLFTACPRRFVPLILTECSLESFIPLRVLGYFCERILLAYMASLGFNPIFSRRGIHWDTSCGAADGTLNWASLSGLFNRCIVIGIAYLCAKGSRFDWFLWNFLAIFLFKKNWWQMLVFVKNLFLAPRVVIYLKYWTIWLTSCQNIGGTKVRVISNSQL